MTRTADDPTIAAGRTLRRSVATLLLLVVVVSVVLVAVPGLEGVTTTLAHADWGWVAAAVVLEVLSGIGYVLTFQLVFDRAPRAFARHLAWAEQAFGAAVPLGGAGGLGVGAVVLHSVGVPAARIAFRSTVVFLLTSAINVFVLVFFGLGVATGVFAGPGNVLLGLLPAAAGAVVIAFFLALPRFAAAWAARLADHQRTAALLRGLGHSVVTTERLLLARDWRALGPYAYLLFDIAVLWACFRALGATPPVAGLVLGYQIGYLANVVPIPGSIGVLDAGLVGALTLYGANATDAVAAVLIYHAIALAVPVVAGAIALVFLRRDLAERPRSRSR